MSATAAMPAPVLAHPALTRLVCGPTMGRGRAAKEPTLFIFSGSPVSSVKPCERRRTAQPNPKKRLLLVDAHVKEGFGEH